LNDGVPAQARDASAAPVSGSGGPSEIPINGLDMTEDLPPVFAVRPADESIRVLAFGDYATFAKTSEMSQSRRQ
jgi:hypothetical protein